MSGNSEERMILHGNIFGDNNIVDYYDYDNYNNNKVNSSNTVGTKAFNSY